MRTRYYPMTPFVTAYASRDIVSFIDDMLRLGRTETGCPVTVRKIDRVPVVPGKPLGVVVTAGPKGSGTIHLNWETADGALGYRIWCQFPSTAPWWDPVGRVVGCSATLSGLTAETLLKFRITAANGDGESLASEIVEIVVP